MVNVLDTTSCIFWIRTWIYPMEAKTQRAFCQNIHLSRTANTLWNCPTTKFL